MALSETTVVDQITITEDGTVQYREATRILKDGVQVAETHHRTTLVPGQELTGAPAQVSAIAQTAWTPEVVAAYQAVQDARAAAEAARAAEVEARMAAAQASSVAPGAN